MFCSNCESYLVSFSTNRLKLWDPHIPTNTIKSIRICRSTGTKTKRWIASYKIRRIYDKCLSKFSQTYRNNKKWISYRARNNSQVFAKVVLLKSEVGPGFVATHHVFIYVCDTKTAAVVATASKSPSKKKQTLISVSASFPLRSL